MRFSFRVAHPLIMLSLQVVDRAGEAHQVAGWEAPDGALYFDLVPQVSSDTKY